MNSDKDLFRQALLQQNERVARMKMPDDIEQRVMECINAKAEEPKNSVFLFALRVVASTAAAVLIGLFLHVYEPTQEMSNDHSYYTTNWT